MCSSIESLVIDLLFSVMLQEHFSKNTLDTLSCFKLFISESKLMK